MNGWLLLRLLGISVGIITLLGVATDYMHVDFDPYVESVLKVLQEIAGLIVAAPLWEMVLDYLRQHFAWVPKPEPHWKPIYTLSALLLLAYARRRPSYMIPIALTCSFVPAAFAATALVGSHAVLIFPLAGFLAFIATTALLRGEWSNALRRLALAAAGAAMGFLSGTIWNIDGTVWLVWLAVIVGLLGLGCIAIGLSVGEGNIWRRLQQPVAAIGLDVLATLGGALALGYLFAA